MSHVAGEVFTFSTSLRRTLKGAFYWISIPARVSRDIGRRGPVPVVSTINGTTELRASLVPIGGGRHRLQLNARVRSEAGVELGDRVKVVLRVDENPQADPTPPDLARALRENGASGAFERFPAGRRSHIVRWIEEAVGERTREKRIDKTVEVALHKAEADHDRELSRIGTRRPTIGREPQMRRGRGNGEN
jgi:uncharacterized protein DUF1905/bacteriocin resistance YdeI/OmpD-like protein